MTRFIFEKYIHARIASIKTLFLTFVSPFIFFTMSVHAQQDSVKFEGTDMIHGEVKQLKNGVLTFETDYSEVDFKIEWNKVLEFHSDKYFTINLSDRALITSAQIKTIRPGLLHIVNGKISREVAVDEVVYFRKLDNKFWSKLSASVDLGFRLTKSNNLRQFNASVNLGYSTDRWTVNGTYRQVRSIQDNTEPIRRVDGSATGDYLLKNSIFFGARINFLSNTEQQINLRTTSVLGAGYYIFRTNTLYWNGFIGAALNLERFDRVPSVEDTSTDPYRRESIEGVIGSELSLFDLGDFSLNSSVYWYPGITEKNRNRLDFRLDSSYDLAKGFYIKAGVTLNYDSQPAPGGTESDYILLTGFGWSL